MPDNPVGAEHMENVRRLISRVIVKADKAAARSKSSCAATSLSFAGWKT
jgi:hypothetical protein